MKSKMLLGIVLLLIGVAALAYEGVTYRTREKAIDLGPLQVTTERTRNIPLSPVVGVVALIGGIALLTINTRNT